MAATTAGAQYQTLLDFFDIAQNLDNGQHTSTHLDIPIHGIDQLEWSRVASHDVGTWTFEGRNDEGARVMILNVTPDTEDLDNNYLPYYPNLTPHLVFTITFEGDDEATSGNSTQQGDAADVAEFLRPEGSMLVAGYGGLWREYNGDWDPDCMVGPTKEYVSPYDENVIDIQHNNQVVISVPGELNPQQTAATTTHGYQPLVDFYDNVKNLAVGQQTSAHLEIPIDDIETLEWTCVANDDGTLTFEGRNDEGDRIMILTMTPETPPVDINYNPNPAPHLVFTITFDEATSGSWYAMRASTQQRDAADVAKFLRPEGMFHAAGAWNPVGMVGPMTEYVSPDGYNVIEDLQNNQVVIAVPEE